MTLNNFLDYIGLKGYSELGEIPVRLFFKGVLKNEFPYKKIRLDHSSKDSLSQMLNEMRHYELRDKLYVEVHMGEGSINFSYRTGIRIEGGDVLWFTH